MTCNRNFLLRLMLLLALATAAAAQKSGPKPMVNPPPPGGHSGEAILIINSQSRPSETQKQGNESCLLQPLNSTRPSVITEEQLRIPARARREYHRACSALRKKKSSPAERHLRQAVQEYPKYATAWVTLGQMLADENESEDAKNACAQAAAVDPIYLPAQLCLAELALRTQRWSEELQHGSRALELDPNSILAYEYDAAANTYLGNLDEAERSGLRALELDKDHYYPAAYLVMAQIYEAKGEALLQEEQLREYLKYSHNPEGTALAKQTLAKLKKGQPEASEIVASKVSRETSVRSPERWWPADIDAVPPVPDDGACPLPQILQQASQRMIELVENLQRFTATEQIEHTEFSDKGEPRRSISELFGYLAEIKQNPTAGFWVNEYRTAKGQTDPPPLADTGTAALALLFHPRTIGNLEIHCEGRVDLQGMPAWQLWFEEGPDMSKSFSSFRIKDSEYRVRLKGRVWISADNFQVSRLQTDLAAPIPDIHLEVEHSDVVYAPVEFAKNKFQLWLPESASMHILYRGRRYQRVHSFSHFQLFLVETEQRVKEPLPSNAEVWNNQ